MDWAEAGLPLQFRSVCRVVHGGFAARRKTLYNSLQISGRISSPPDVILEAIEHAGIEPGARGDALPVDAWVRLASALPAQV